MRNGVSKMIEATFKAFKITVAALGVGAVLALQGSAFAACTQVCTTTADCGAVTYETRCVNGACFQFPRQHCVPRQVCQNVCK
jgi:hypothetical protein